MDEGIQAPESPDPVGHTNLAGGATQPRAGSSSKWGRPKKQRPLTPTLARELAVVILHFFPQMSEWLGEVRDPRNPLYTVYPLKVLLLLGVLIFLTHSGSRNHFNDQIRDAKELLTTLARILGCDVEDLPHLDTLEKVIRRLQPDDFQHLMSLLIRRLIRMKALDGWRSEGRLLLAVDGTGLYSFKERHCEHCIEMCHASGVTTYSHSVLVAFIVSHNGYALPIACEFIENPGPVYNRACPNAGVPALGRNGPGARVGLILAGIGFLPEIGVL